MQTDKQLKIGLFGFGVVGQGLYQVIQKTPSLNASIKKICIKNPEKQRNATADLFTTDRYELLDDPEINVIVEVIDDAEAAFEIASQGLRNKKDVVSASKKMIAENLPTLLRLQNETGCSLLYEAAVCASIPFIRNLEEYYDNDLLHSIKAIVNGSTNYILTKMIEEKKDLKQALLEAQQAGFAESDPRLDLEGYDAVNKWSIILAHAFGIIEDPANILFSGIQQIQPGDIHLAETKKQKIRLVAEARKLRNGKLAAFVLPRFVKQEDHLAFVKDEYNGVVIESSFADKQFFYGKGAGSFPTASALLSDIAALRYRYKYEYKKIFHHSPHELDDNIFLRVNISFDKLENISKDSFEWIEEWHEGKERKWLQGVIALPALKNSDWWKKNNVSLILDADAIIEDISIRRVKKRSLELAGVF